MGNQNIKYKDVPLIKEIEKCNDNILYYGEGGIGKTTQMQLAFNYFSSKCTNTVPVFLDADKEIDFRKADPLMSAIAGKYLDSDIETDDIWKLFTNNSPSSAKNYTYIIFVDGINELTQNNKGYLIEKITHIINESKNARFIISSRIKENLGLRFKNIAIKPLEKKNILKYLGENYGANDNSKNINDSLVEILQIPLYLSVFKNTYNGSDYKPNIYDESTVRKADILDSYIQKILHEKRKTNAADTALFEFIVKYFLPALAFEMVKENVHVISIMDFRKLRDNTEYFETFCYDDNALDIFEQNSRKAHNYIVENFALLESHKDVYTFTHQIWRDYFCAKHIINCLNVTYSEQIKNDLEIPVDNEIRGFVGQLIYTYDEKFHYSKDEHFPSKKSDRMCECDFEAKDNLEDWYESPIEHYMQQHNLEQEGQNQISPLVTRNLIEIMKASRNDTITGNYVALNLLNSDFLNLSCKNSIFNYSLLNSSVFYRFQHWKTTMIYDEDDSCLWFGDRYGNISTLPEECFLYGSGILTHKYTLDGYLTSIIMLGNNQLMVCIFRDKPPVIINKYTGNCIQELSCPECYETNVWKVSVTSLTKEIIVATEKNVYVWKPNGNKYIRNLSIEFDNELKFIESASISENGHYLLVCGYSGDYYPNKELMLFDLVENKISYPIKSAEKATIFDNSIIFLTHNNHTDLNREFSLEKYNLYSKITELLFETDEKLQLVTDAKCFYAIGKHHVYIYEKGTYKNEVININQLKRLQNIACVPKHKRIFFSTGIKLDICNYSERKIENSIILSQGETLYNHVINYSHKHNKFYILFHGAIKVINNDKNLSVCDTFMKADDENAILSFTLNDELNELIIITEDSRIKILDAKSGILKSEFKINITDIISIGNISYINNKVFFSKHESRYKKYYIIDLSKKSIKSTKNFEVDKNIYIKGNYLYETFTDKKITQISILDLQTKNIIQSITIDNSCLDFEKFPNEIPQIKDILYLKEQNYIFICFYWNENVYLAFDESGNKMTNDHIACSSFQEIQRIDNLIYVNNNTLAFYCDFGVATYSLQSKKIIALNNNIIYSDIAGSIFRHISNISKMDSFNDIILKNGGII